MAIGDDASAAGMDTVAGVDDLRDSYVEHNRTRDYLAVHQTSGTHAASAITSGTLDDARLPNIPVAKIPSAIPTSKIHGGQWDNDIDTIWNIKTTALLVAAGTYANVLSSGYRVVYVNTSGVIGTVPSARRYKQNIKPVSLEALGKIIDATPVEFDYVKKIGGGHDTGLIADELEALGLDFLVVRAEDGEVDGIHYERVCVALLAVAKQQAARLDAIEKRLGETEDGR